MENLEQLTYDFATGETALVPFTAEEITEREAYIRDVLPVEQLAALRFKRNQLLAETDYLALSDVTLTEEMKAYRQALRDLPSNTSDPANPVWPTKPGGDS